MFFYLTIAVLLHYKNLESSVPIAFAIKMDESYDTMRQILDCERYEEHNWNMCCDLKVVTFLCGLQKGNTKYSCHLCLWDSRYTGCQYEKKIWPMRSETTRQIDKYNIVCDALVPADKILLPQLHIKLGLAKNFLKFVQRHNEDLKTFLDEFFPNLSKAKLAEGMSNSIA